MTGWNSFPRIEKKFFEKFQYFSKIMTIFEKIFWKTFSTIFTNKLKILEFQKSSFFVKIAHFLTLIRKLEFSRYTSTQRGFIYDQNDLENDFIKSESLFDPFLVPKTTYFEFLAYFRLFSSGFAFRF